MSAEVLHTKFGRARINKDGYYWITSSKEGNTLKYLHRLIWEDFYGCKVPEGFLVHHKNENKLDNCILNLQLMRKVDHLSHHHKGKKLSKETRMKQSKAKKGKNHPRYKDYARVVKHGKQNDIQKYTIKKDGQFLKTSYNPLVLSKWFEENYPDETLENKFEDLGCKSEEKLS